MSEVDGVADGVPTRPSGARDEGGRRNEKDQVWAGEELSHKHTRRSVENSRVR